VHTVKHKLHRAASVGILATARHSCITYSCCRLRSYIVTFSHRLYNSLLQPYKPW